MAGISSLGLGSGIDIKTIVEGLVAAERQPQEFQFTKQETSLQAKLSSFGIFKSGLSDFRASLAGLRDSGKFLALKATSSDSSVISASAGNNADVGKFSLESKQLAQAHGLASAGFSEANATVGTGTLTIKFGATTYDPDQDAYTGFTQNADKATLTINLDASNNTLTGMRDAINNAKAGVNASIVYDGSAYRLVLASEDTGRANSMQIVVSDPSLANFEFNSSATNMTQTQVAQDAVLSINGLDITNTSNSFKNALKGVTLDLARAQPGQKINLDIAKSSSGVVDALEGFIKSYNELNTNVKQLSSYDATTKTGSALLGDATLRTAMSQVRSILGGVVDGLQGSSFKNLIDLGLKTDADGSLKLDKTKLNAALSSDPEGVAAIFTQLGRPDNEKVQFFASTTDTKTGKYAVEVTQAATQGTLTGSGVTPGFLTVTAGSNDTFKIKVDGNLSAAIVLSAGTYANGEALAAEIQSKINGDTSLKAKGATVQVAFDSDNNSFVLSSKSYGAVSGVEITESTALNMGLVVGSGTAGMDVAGTIGGVAATGSGQFLTSSGGLKLLIEGDATGSLGNVTFSRGLMEKLDNVLGGLLNNKGSLTAKTDGLQKSLDLISKERVKLETKIADYEQRLLSKFNAMDALLGQIQSTGTFLGQQLASLPYNNLSKNS
jgi:flagellar hook-associated protein 2